MSKDQPIQSERKTGNEPVSGIDPGGARSAPGRGKQPVEAGTKGRKVETGDRNKMKAPDPINKP